MMFDEEIDVRRLRLNPGDVVILRLPATLSRELADRAAERLKNVLDRVGRGEVPVVMLEKDIEVETLAADIIQGSEGPVAVHRLPAASPDPVGLPADVVALVLASRAVAFADWNAKVLAQSPQHDLIKNLDRASEAFADRVPWDDSPDAVLVEATDRPTQRVALELVVERMRQITGEGRSRWNDDLYRASHLAAAAAAYALAASVTGREGDAPWSAESASAVWPWDRSSFKPTDPRRDLVKAGALILAEIERIDRAAYVATLEAEA